MDLSIPSRSLSRSPSQSPFNSKRMILNPVFHKFNFDSRNFKIKPLVSRQNRPVVVAVRASNNKKIHNDGFTLEDVPHLTNFLPDLLSYPNPVKKSQACAVVKQTFIGPEDAVAQKVYFKSDEVCACIVTYGGLCPGINTVIREIVRGLSYMYGVDDILGIENGTVENGVCFKESVNGSCDVWSCKHSDASSADHLVVMVHGILGSAIDWKFGAKQFLLRDCLIKFLCTVRIVFICIMYRKLIGKFCECSERNMSKLTLDGVDVMGECLAQEVLEVIERKPNLQKISFVAHSVGGLVAINAIGRLYRRPKMENGEDSSADTSSENLRGTIAGLEAINFITVATPHLSSRGNKQVPFLFGVTAFEKAANFVIHLIFRRTGRHLFLNDNDEGRPALLRRMAEDEDESYFMSALRAFKRREPVKGLSRVSWEKIDVSFHNCRQRFAAHSVIQIFDYNINLLSIAKALHTVSVRKAQYPVMFCGLFLVGLYCAEELVKGLSRVSWGKIDVSFHNCRQRFAAQVLIVLYR
ncbi:DUF676 domain-containing protein [Citrus sinensis]|nr:DUF676 domain-containing protein [Citrus sinensis]